MSECKRYDLAPLGKVSSGYVMQEAEYGNWVTWGEYYRQAKQLEAMKYVSERADHKIAQQEKRIATMKTGLGQIKQIAELQPVDRAIYNIAEAALLPQKENQS